MRFLSSGELQGRLQLFAQAPASSTDDLFAKYPVETSFKGRPALPVLANRQRAYLEHVSVKASLRASLLQVTMKSPSGDAVVDAFLSPSSMPLPAKYTFFLRPSRKLGKPGTVDIQTGSRAIHVIGSLNEEDSADRWYVWNDNKFDLVSKKPAALLDDNGSPITP